jgi:hypothetical protein
MKTTIDLSDELLAEAKATAVRRRTTLKAVIEHALKREIRSDTKPHKVDSPFIIDNHGLPVLKKTGSTKVTSEMVYDMMEDAGI